MTEAEWFTDIDHCRQYDAVAHLMSERQIHLYAVGCAQLTPKRCTSELLDRAIDVVGRAAEGAAGQEEVEAVHAEATEVCNALNATWCYPRPPSHFMAFAAERLTYWPVPYYPPHVRGFLAEALGCQPYPPRESDRWVHLIHRGILQDIVYNPYRDVRGKPLTGRRRLRRPLQLLKPGWYTPTVVALADGIYSDVAFDRLPILADALQDAGCDLPDVFDHCRDPKLVHVRGCWVVDHVLGRS